jgi:hypothetical protein
MPTPIAPGIIRVQAILHGRSGLPEDRYITTWHFRTPLTGAVPPSDGAQEVHHDAAREKVREFFLVPPSTTGVSVRDYWSGVITRGPLALELRSYHLGDAEPRQPQISRHDILGTAPSASLPSEVAVTMSFSGGVGLPRQRGRVYIGPLMAGGAVLNQSDQNGRPRVEDAMRLVLTQAALRMSGGGDTEPARWVVYSPTNNSSVLVTRGFVDDAFDTQRRRGEEAVTRTSWS